MTEQEIIKIFGGARHCKKNNYGYYEIYRREPALDRDVCVASYHPSLNEVRPTHGYFVPHKIGNAIKRKCEKNGITFNNN
jgi:hypothetical protein